jgi:hypothetical protein
LGQAPRRLLLEIRAGSEPGFEHVAVTAALEIEDDHRIAAAPISRR